MLKALLQHSEQAGDRVERSEWYTVEMKYCRCRHWGICLLKAIFLRHRLMGYQVSYECACKIFGEKKNTQSSIRPGWFPHLKLFLLCGSKASIYHTPLNKEQKALIHSLRTLSLDLSMLSAKPTQVHQSFVEIVKTLQLEIQEYRHFYSAKRFYWRHAMYCRLRLLQYFIKVSLLQLFGFDSR